MYELQTISERQGSSISIEFNILDLSQNQYVSDFTNYSLVMKIRKNDKTVLKTYNGELKQDREAFVVSIPYTDTQQFPCENLYWEIILDYPTNQKKVMVGELMLEWGESING